MSAAMSKTELLVNESGFLGGVQASGAVSHPQVTAAETCDMSRLTRKIAYLSYWQHMSGTAFTNGEISRSTEVLCANFRLAHDLAEEATMLCPELERLEKRQIEVRTAQGNVELPERKRIILQDDERSIIMAIADHKSFGHGGRPCPCK
jgi:hypothetical protein